MEIRALAALIALLFSLPAWCAAPDCGGVWARLAGRPLSRAEIPERPSLQELEHRIYAVHATNFFPEDGVIRAGASDISGPSARVGDDPPSFRPTVHFSLGELVRPHGQHSWEDRKHAVLLPLGALKKQLVNVNTYDTYVLGDFRLPPGAVAVIPEGSQVRVPPGVRVVRYDPESQSLRQAIDEQIESAGGWPIRMKRRLSPSLDSIATVEGKDSLNVNSPEFFGPLLRESGSSFGDHIRSQQGTAYRFGALDAGMNRLYSQYRPHSHSLGTAETRLLRDLIGSQLQKLDREIAGSAFPPEARATYASKRARLLGWLNVVDADLALRENHGVTLAGASKEVLEGVSRLRDDPKQLEKFLKKQRTFFRRAYKLPSESKEFLAPAVAVDYLASVPLQEARRILNHAAGGSDSLATPEFVALHSVKRSMVLDLPAARQEGLIQNLSQGLARISERSSADRKRFAESLMDLLGESLDESSSRLGSSLELLRSRPVREFLESTLEFRLPEGDPTLRGFLDAYPKTRAAFNPPRSSVNDPVTLRILEVLDISPARGGNPGALGSFNRARQEAGNSIFLMQVFEESAASLNQPMKTARPIKSIAAGVDLTVYEQILRGDFGTLDEFWNRFGLRQEFRARFPRDEDFWKSRESLRKIYDQLKR